MRLIEYLWLKERVSPGSARLSIIAVPTVLFGMFLILVFGGEDALGLAVKTLLVVGVISIVLLPFLGLFWAAIWFMSLFPDRKPTRPARD